ncbi:MAG: type II toxin-antitoxin system RelE/ParE family toxin [Bryobacterales bacterium]|nr:type II toxin-antitoxin system RelE/ParE family toxin [Bryobacterales bacterium]
MPDEPPFKPVVWVGSSRKDLREFPDVVQDHMDYALYVAQEGGKHRDAKTLTGFGGAGVIEIVKDYHGDAFRAVYTLRYQGWCMCFTPSRRNPRAGVRHHAGMSS